jgi:hypothetical protein
MKNNVSDLYDKIQGESTGLGNLLSKIPGISGYMEKGRRREADQILRDTIANRLEQSRIKMGTVMQDLSRDIVAAIDHAEPLGRVDTKLAGLIGKIEAAPQGYAGFFDAIKVKEDDLARIYSFDSEMLTFADEIDSAIDALSKAVVDGGDVGGSIRTLDGLLNQANASFATRDEVIQGIA